MVGHATPALDLEDRHARRRAQVFPVGAAAHGQHMGVFSEHQGVGDFVALAGGHQFLLHVPRLRVVTCAEIDDSCWLAHSPRASRGT